jgi:P27 family predicted phage terminase small subunit
MTRGRKPKPAHLKVIEGNRGRRPIRPDLVPLEAFSAPVEPPDHLSDIAKEEWARLAPSMSLLGLLTELDRAAFAAYCQSYARWVQAEHLLAMLMEQDPSGRSALLMKSRAGNICPNPLVWIGRNAANDMIRYAAEFGLSPSARARVQGAYGLPVGGRSKFDGLLGASKASEYFD